MIEFDLPGISEQTQWRSEAPFTQFVRSDGSDGAMPFAEVDVHSGYGPQPGFIPVVEEMPPLFAAGHIYGAPIAATEISGVQGDRPFSTWVGTGLPDMEQAWAGTSYVYVATSSPQVNLSFQCCLLATVAPRDATSLYAQIPDNFTVESVELNGTPFALAVDSDNPAQYEYLVFGKTVILYNNNAIAFGLGEVCICGQVTDYPAEAIADISYYNLEGSDATSVDEVVHLSHSYRRASSLLSPILWTFRQDEDTLVLISELGKGEPRRKLPIVGQGEVMSVTVVNMTYTPEG